MKKALDLAVVGASGYWGKIILPNLTRIKQVRLRALVSHSTAPSSLRSLAPTRDVLLTSDFGEVLEREDIAAVVIATATHSHYQMAMRAINAGKHVFIEKPPALTYREAWILAAAASRKNVVAMVDHIYLFSKCIRKMKKMIQSGAIGEPLHFSSIRANFGRFRNDSDSLSDLGYHDIYIIRELFSEYKPQQVTCSMNCSLKKKHAAICSFSVQFRGGLTADVYLSWLSPSKDRRILVAGTEGILEFHGDRELIHHRKSVCFRDKTFASADKGSRVIPYKGEMNPLQDVLEHFVKSALRGEASTICGLREGAETVRWQDRIRKSAVEGKPVRL